MRGGFAPVVPVLVAAGIVLWMFSWTRDRAGPTRRGVARAAAQAPAGVAGSGVVGAPGAWSRPIIEPPRATTGSATSTASDELRPRPAPDEEEAAAAIRCATPLPWWIAELDPRFGLTRDEVTAIVNRAAGLWEFAVGARLFSHEPNAGIAIRFLFDERQAHTLERRRQEAAFDSADARLRSWRAELDTHAAREARRREQHRERLLDFQRRVAEHNAEVAAWNERGSAPADVVARLDSLGAELDRERRDLARWEEELVAAERRLEAEAERFNRALADHRRTADSLVRAFPVRRIQSGRYQESLKLRDGQVVGLEREIRIHQFDNPEDLVFIIAHELGHALGLGHAEEPGALMSAEFYRTGASGVRPRNPARGDGPMATIEGMRLAGREAGGRGGIRPADVALLRKQCPGIFADGH